MNILSSNNVIPFRRKEIVQQQNLCLKDYQVMYEHRTTYKQSEIPSCRPLDHTMTHSLDSYVSQKLPTETIINTLAEGGHIEVHGIYPEHIKTLEHLFGYSSVEVLPFCHNISNKHFNYVRPAFFTSKKGAIPVLIVAVTPGLDYFRHYCAILKHFVLQQTMEAEKILKLYWYPDAQAQLTDWTELNDPFIKPNDVVILGYVEELKNLLTYDYQFINRTENKFYCSLRYRVGSNIINFLGVKFSYWGNLSGIIVSKCCYLGAKEIIYSAKLGTLQTESHIYNYIFSPSVYINVNQTSFKNIISDVPNRLLDRMPWLNSGKHASVPTVLEEDYKQRSLLENLGVTSIDNEISQIALAISQFNNDHGKNVSFSAIHFATDYLRNQSEKKLKTSHDLSNNRTNPARDKKKAVIEQISIYLKDYFYGTL